MASRDRLRKLFQNIKDKDLQLIIASTVDLESKNRNNFPRQKLRDIVDATARNIQKNGKTK